MEPRVSLNLDSGPESNPLRGRAEFGMIRITSTRANRQKLSVDPGSRG